MTLFSRHFMRHTELTDFVISSGLVRANILKIDTDSMNGGFVIWYYA